MPVKKKKPAKKRKPRGFSVNLRGMSKKQKAAAEKKFLAKVYAKFGKQKVFAEFFKKKRKKPKK